ncbi:MULTISPECIES: peptidoglycan-binding protein [unclassified Streptomyces]|uniref:L,D-transpeptidase family protein n=1 Tax=unclassified Streptomyces TaxID=2593676 RepID=UPI0037F754B5
MLRTSVLCRGLATAAVLAVSVGCTVRPATAGPDGDAKPGGGGAVGANVAATPVPVEERAEAAEEAETPAPTPTPTPPPSPTPVAVKPAPTPTPEALMTPGSTSDQVRELQARLRQIGYFERSPTGYYGTLTTSAVAAFQAKRGLPRTGVTDVVTWQRLLAMTEEPSRDELRPPTTQQVAAPDPRCVEGRVLCISKNSSTLSWMVDGTVLSSMDVRFGSQYTPTREGVFSVGWKSRDHVSTLYDTPMPYAMFFSGGQAVHYSADFAARGYTGASHGCVNVRDREKVASLFDQVRVGDKVVIYW